jgi:hypothetical protein
MSKVTTVAVAIVSMLCASVSCAQSSYTPMPVYPSSESLGNVQFQSEANNWSGQGQVVSPDTGRLYVACWAEVSSQNTAYFSATLASPSVNALRKQFRTFVTTHYGPVSNVQCTGKFSETMVNERVEKWKDSARTANNAIIDLFASTGDEAAKASQPQSPQSVRVGQPHSGFGFPPGPPPSVPSLSTSLQRY